jgi:subtilisin family serine protease
MNRTLSATLAIGTMVSTVPAAAQIPLPTGPATASAATTTEFVKTLRSAGGSAAHGLATFSRYPEPAERRNLEASGVRIFSPLVGTTYRVRVEARASLRGGTFAVLRTNLLRLTAQDRVEPRLWRGDYPRHAVNPDGSLSLSVRIHPGVSEADSRRVLAAHASRFGREGDQEWVAVVPQASLRALAGEDIVQWIDAGPLPFIAENDRVRNAMSVDAVQSFDETTGTAAGLGGKGVRVGVFDKGVDETHDDFDASAASSRVTVNDAPMQFHGTHVAGTIGGNGKLSTGNDSWGNSNVTGTPPTKAYQWRGMATDVLLLDIDQMPPFGQNGKNPDTHARYIASPGMDLSNHSYVFSVDGAYDSSNQARDRIIRGDALSGGSAVPPRLHVTSAGNSGQTAFSGSGVTSFQKGYFSLTKQVKNALVVGNWDISANRLANTSSLGPTHDGRIKPDVVAPGVAVTSAGYCVGVADPDEKSPQLCESPPASGNYTPRQDFYRVLSGTSMASAAASGVLTLVLERYARTYGVNLSQSPPLPSTLRAVMIHAAVDKAGSPSFTNPDGVARDSPGPDFLTGWGLINAKRAVELVANKAIIEGVVATTCDSRVYSFQVAPGTAGMRVTLAWDDVAADALVSATDPTAPLLRNDLDLVLVAPDGREHLPWQLDQRIVDSAGNLIPADLQHCGTAIRVQRKLTPVANPSSGNESVPNEGSIPKAVGGRDHLNNVEVVDVEAPTAGTWQARVTGFAIPDGPQKFSLIGSSFTRLLQGPKSLCIQYPVLCQRVALPQDLCQRYPKLCEPKFKFSQPWMHVPFDEGQEKVVLPLDGLCRHSTGRPDADCSGHELRVRSKAGKFRVEIYSAGGRRLGRNASATADKRLSVPARADEEHFVVLSLGPGAKPGTELEVSLAPK